VKNAVEVDRLRYRVAELEAELRVLKKVRPAVGAAYSVKRKTKKIGKSVKRRKHTK
jgi:hypothetical protein